ncbi:hypothetical protein LSH36_107g02025 [Paralvinella palmiformis]|uniref:Katanin p60 ATPase-containing subunit A-like 2 n=1 Tax=Paralvinella palmiformis TaxID=53620 RepID=A0AAD9JZ60_9ANNE|nr:hypothetical protein LSH36_107g02025 [Paralvinella palmiformis]
MYTRPLTIIAQRYGVKYRLYADDILSEIEYNPGASCRPTVDPPSGEWFYLARRRDVVTALTTVNNLLEMSDTLSYQAIRSANVAREADEIRTETRKKNLLILMLHYLNEEGYVESARSLSKETNIDLNRYVVCDNVDLETVLMDYESFYYTKFSRYPKITKKLISTTEEKGNKFQRGSKTRRDSSSKVSGTPSLPRLPPPHTRQTSPPPSSQRPKSGIRRALNSRRDASRQNGSVNGSLNSVNGDTESLSLHGTVVQTSAASTSEANTSAQPGKVRSKDRLLKPLGGYMGYSSDWRDLAQVISRDIYLNDPNVRWDDIIGLDQAKRLVKEAVVYPIRYPQLFTGILSPWKGLLLYGPPGTGKTLLAKAVATECNTTFFNISASSIVSKWRGDSEKLVRVLFELARFHAPSTIFLDELESLMSQRGSQGGGGEHEGSRRMKTELLVQMDGLSKSDDLVFLLAASNLPWELDHAMLRRLEKRILVDLPTCDARKAMFIHHLPAIVCTSQENGLELISDIDYDEVATKTEGYSGADIRLVCKEAAMRPVRKIFDALENHTEGDIIHIELDYISTQGIESVLDHSKPSAKFFQAKYIQWQKCFESA